MNPLTNVKNIKKLSEEELKGRNRTSWHDQYRGSAWLFVGGLPYDLTEGDIICVFSQYGEPVNVNLIRDKETGKSKGFCFICYEDQRSTDLAVDNFNGIKVLGRTIRVDHVENYKPPKSNKDEKRETTSNATKERPTKEKASEGESSSDKVSDDGRALKKRKKKRRDCEFDSDSSGKKKRKKDVKTQKRKRENLQGNASVESGSDRKKIKKQKHKSSDSDSSSSSSSSETSLSDSHDVDKKNKKKRHKSQRSNRNRTIEDLKREARLIHAELKRRQRMEEQEKKAHLESDEEQRRKRDHKASR